MDKTYLVAKQFGLIGNRHTKLGYLLVLLTSLWFSCANAANLAQIKTLLNLNVDTNAISVSGLSSGAYMAVQYHIAHSSTLTGVASVAGGPYHCAGTSSFLCDYVYWFLPQDSCQASYACSATARTLIPFGFYIGPPDHEQSVDSALAQAAQGTIDSLAGLNNDRIWIFTSGRPDKAPHDTFVPHDIALELRQFYQDLYNQAQEATSDGITLIDSVQAEHSFIIDDPNREDNCAFFGPPFIDDCSFNTAASLLDYLHPNISKQTPAGAGQLLAFEQTAPAQATLADTGHIYVPAGCQGNLCPLHIALHGCGQTQTIIDSNPETQKRYFFKDTGYNPWADTANVIILYPQTRATAVNEQACWDWWGYSSDNYYNQSAPQIQAIHSMVTSLTQSQ